MTENFKKKLTEQLSDMKLELTDKQTEQLFTYYEMLVETNKVMNLTAITEEDDVITKHFVDSLALVKAFCDTDVSRETSMQIMNEALNGKKMIDVGTGAGFPGLVIKIAFPELDVTLTDSLMKRLKFLDSVIEKLGLEKVHTVHGRAEDLGHDKSLRESYDYSVSRAVANLSTLSEYDLPFVAKKGLFIAYKSGEIETERHDALHAISILGGKLEKEVEYNLPETDIKRSLVLIRKAKETPGKYPRKAGTPAKEPIK